MSYLTLILSNLGHNKLRTGLTAVTVVFAVLLVCILITMPDGLDAIISRASSNVRISVHNKAGLAYLLPESFTRKIRAIDGVSAAVGTLWFGGAFEQPGKVTFPNFSVEPEHIGSVFPDYNIEPKQLEDFQRYRDGALVGRQIMERYGWKVGQRVTLTSSVLPLQLDFRIVGEIPNERNPLFWLNREYVDQALQAQGSPPLGIIGIVWVRVNHPDRINSVMRAIEDISRNSDFEAAAETEQSFFSGFFGSLQDFVRIIVIVSAMVTLCIVFVAANTASISIRERAQEIAMLRAVGFSRRIIFSILFAETLLLSSVAGLLGVGLALGLTRGARALIGTDPTLGPLGSFIVTPPIALQGMLLSILVGIIAGVLPAYHAVRRPVAEVLHDVF